MKKKIIQTIVDESEYDEFRKVSEKTGKTIREAAREAIRKWTEEASGISPEDPIFRIKPVSYGDSKVSEQHDSALYGREL
ncbi:MAG: hypothetical protein HYW93_04400 [Thaumarchaeota archaeon]|nr:hypothetical protein [Nitrososphaerota archaeon]